MSIVSRLTDDIKKSLKGRDALRCDTVRFLLSQLKNTEIERRVSGVGELSELDLIAAVRRLIGQEKETIEFLRKESRTDAIRMSEAKIGVLESYLPKALSDVELESLIAGVVSRLNPQGLKDFGKVMKEVLAEAAGRAEGSRVSQALKSKLASL